MKTKLLLSAAFTMIGLFLTAQTNVNGFVYYGEDETQSISGVNVLLLDNTNGSILQSTFTNSVGEFQFSNVYGGDYVLKASHDAITSGTGLDDIDKTQDYLDGTGDDLSEIDLKAADLNGSGSITNGDLQLMENRYSSSSTTDEWVFEEIAFVLPTGIQLPDTSFKIKGKSMGDVSNPDPIVIARPGLTVAMEYNKVQAVNNTFNFPVALMDDITVRSFSMSFQIPNNHQVLEINPLFGNLKYRIEDNIVTLYFINRARSINIDANTLLAEIRTTASSDISGKAELNFTTSEGLNKYKGLKIASNSYTNESTITANVYPNPIQSSATLELNIDQQQDVNISIYNVQGKKVQEVYKGQLFAGMHQITINRNSLTAGIYFMMIQYQNESKVFKQKIIVQ